MKFCYSCGKNTGGKPLFCTFCGRSYDVKVCPRLHLNPRWAEACSRCGSRNLSIPQPRVPFVWRLLVIAILAVPGLLLFTISLAVALDVGMQIAHRQTSSNLQERILLLPLLGAIWTIFPDAFRAVIRYLLQRRSRELG